MLQKLHFQETRRSWQEVIKGLLLFCILYLQIQLSDLQITSTKDQLGALSWGRDGKIGVLGWFFFFSSVMLLQILCIYADIHTCMDLDTWIISDGILLRSET